MHKRRANFNLNWADLPAQREFCLRAGSKRNLCSGASLDAIVVPIAISISLRKFARLPIILLFIASVCGTEFAMAQSPNECDPAKVITSETCAKCHANEYNVWKSTPHFRTFDTLHRAPQARSILDRMGIKGSIKRSGICIDCHYTPQLQEDKLKPVSGVSCESCHGAAQDWVTIHNNFGGPGITRAQEPETHRLERITASVELGMRNPRNLYLVARSCLACHTVPNEDLVNIGGHTAGSEAFEMVSWSQGMLRHNFVRSNGQANETSAPQRLRIMYLAGLIADVEFSLRATARATERGVYGHAVAARAARNAMKLYQIQQQLQHPLLEEILIAFSKVELKTNNAAELNAVADQIQQCGQQLATQIEGNQLAFLDSQIPDASQYK
jgi:hypothetical protein